MKMKMRKTFLAVLCAGGVLGACSNEPVKPVAAAAPAPAPVESPPVATAPAPTPAPQPVTRNVLFTVSMDAFFDFDKATLRPEGMAALDDLATRLAVTNYDVLTIVGHADRIGAADYNQKLSERRALAMRDYLVAQGVSAQKISASGVGSTQPTAACPDLRGTALIDCLQPDRNAELNAAGSETVVSAADATE
ncbi:MAG: OmpA family protein [Hyphomicrobiales bacterium]|nr:OmpA family protein [Hyphomicrobiales bacterium]